jgi:tryptophanyl-tRNA synthetase
VGDIRAGDAASVSFFSVLTSLHSGVCEFYQAYNRQVRSILGIIGIEMASNSRTRRSVYFIANYHSMTSLFDAEQRRKNTLEVALDFLACGLDPKKSVFWKQSDLPEVTELTWLLSTVAPMGLLERCHSYKKKKARLAGNDLDKVNHGLFAYPVLMARTF